MRSNRSCAALAIGILSLAAFARADVLNLNVVGSSSSVNTSGSGLPELVNDLINKQGKFQSLDGQSYNASLNYGDVKNAITFDSNASGTDVTLRIPSTGLVKRFTGGSSNDVQEQIKDFLIKNGDTEYAKFLQKVNEQSLLGVVDGNPHATTAIFSNHAFDTFGLNRSPARLDAAPAGNLASNLRFDIEGGVASNDETDESFITGAISTGIAAENIGLTFTTIGNYRDLEGSAVYSIGFELGVPIMILPPKGDRTLSWQVTPHGVLAAGGSYDLAAGGTLGGIGITSALAWRYERWIFTLANQITAYEGFPIDIGEYKFDTDVSQQVLKNGVSVAYIVGHGYLDLGVSYTQFLQEAAVDQYVSPMVGAGVQFGDSSGIHIAYKGDFGSDYTSHGGEISLYFGY